jgi:hypothetical protein
MSPDSSNIPLDQDSSASVEDDLLSETSSHSSFVPSSQDRTPPSCDSNDDSYPLTLTNVNMSFSFDSTVSSTHLRLKGSTIGELYNQVLCVSLPELRRWFSLHSWSAVGPRNAKSSFLVPLICNFLSRLRVLEALDSPALILPLRESRVLLASNVAGLVYQNLQQEFPSSFLSRVLYVGALNQHHVRRNARLNARTQAEGELIDERQCIIDQWPQPIPEEVLLERCSDYVAATNIKVPRPCTCCGRSFPQEELRGSFRIPFDVKSLSPDHPLYILRADRYERDFIAPFSKTCSALDDLMIHHSYVNVSATERLLHVQLCQDCDNELRASKIPKFSLRNNLYRGRLPDDLQDITWVEEKVCALHRVYADVARLFNGAQGESVPYRLVGNTCAYPCNVASTAVRLPRTPADVNGNLTIVFVGPKFDANKLPRMFRVRRRVIQRLLNFLSVHNPLYTDVPICHDTLNEYPEDGILPHLAESVIFTPVPEDSPILAEESASFEDHPAMVVRSSAIQMQSDGSAPDTNVLQSIHTDNSVIESTGIIDFEGTSYSGHSATANALNNLIRPVNQDKPDLVLRRGAEYVKEYDNPSLLPGMFPTLFPYGGGGLEEVRPIAISFQEHSNYLLSLYDTAFKCHRLFLFVVLNIMKRRRAHLFTSFTVKKPGFFKVAKDMASVSAATLEATANHLRNNGRVTDLTPEQRKAYDCLKQLNIVTGHIPGSPAAKLVDRSSMFAYFGLFGLPQIFLTMNYPTLQSPIFHVMVGDENVDLSSRFPKLPFPEEKARRYADNPVAAADFFLFSMRMFFKHLLGYDMDSGESMGGILGHVLAHYGKAECTGRGNLHCHHLIWLLGGLNPSDIHNKLDNNQEFQTRFFAFWEQIIKHDTPLKGVEISPSFDPRSERPPHVGSEEWFKGFDQDVSACAEALQRHEHREICSKYQNNVSHLPISERPCRFQFPHDIVPESRYDPVTKSIVFACRDATMNYYNPYILVICRHNHDIKCILSGKSAKAGLMYITNYVTKDDLKTHHVISLMSSTIAHMKEDETASECDRAKRRLQRWVLLVGSDTEIHAQQAVLYIRGVNDSFYSHETIPMLSLHLLSVVKSLYPVAASDPRVPTINTTPPTPVIMVDRSQEDEDNTSVVSEGEDEGGNENEKEEVDNEEDAERDEEGFEQPSIRVFRSEDGSLRHAPTQVDDYFHRDPSLQHLNFYQFVCCLRKEKKLEKARTRQNADPRFDLSPPHPQASTHCLRQFQDPDLPWHMWGTPPRVVGMKIPRPQDRSHPIFMLAHFKPFSLSNPLIEPGVSFSTLFKSYQFAALARRIMKNWEDIHECEDERDADRLRRKQREGKVNEEMKKRVDNITQEEDGGPVIPTDLPAPSKESNRRMLESVSLLKGGGWLNIVHHCTSNSSEYSTLSIPQSIPDMARIKLWREELRKQEKAIKTARMNAGNVLSQTDYDSESNSTPSTLSAEEYAELAERFKLKGPPSTLSFSQNDDLMTSRALMLDIGAKAGLNDRQWRAYLIVAQKFLENEELLRQKEPIQTPLRLLLTGPGGTGKTHVVKALQKLMSKYGAEHKLRLLAPTGSAAQGIDASTVHKSLGMQVRKKRNAKGTNIEDWFVEMSKAKQFELETDWKDIEYVFVDEVSLIGADLNARIDQVLRQVKGNDDWYGRVNMIFAGDFCQYPPVQALPIYEPITSSSRSKGQQDIMNRLGRLAWKSINAVVELTEQMRMKSDPEYGECVARLRLRECTEEDVSLFNSRILRSPRNPAGVRLSPSESNEATAIVADNRTRQHLNKLKAETRFSEADLVICAARDTYHDGTALSLEAQRVHIDRDYGSQSKSPLPSIIPLAIGMRVVLRRRNISPELKISNGSTGILLRVFTSQYGGYDCADGAVVSFPGSPLQLPGLPLGCAFIQPVHCTYSLPKEGSKKGAEEIERFRRDQLPLEPAYAVTGHFAQGKTLPVVVASLKQRDPAASYVIASRATSRNGLFLMDEVTLNDLNRPLPRALRMEMKRLSALEHNTAVAEGFIEGPNVKVPDQEEIDANNPSGMKLRWELKSGGKRKRSIADEEEDDVNKPNSRSRRPVTHPYPFPSLEWEASTYSCAYDSLLTPLYAAWFHANSLWKTAFTLVSPHLTYVSSGFQEISSAPPAHDTHALLTHTRDQLRDVLNVIDRHSFPRVGTMGTSMAALLDVLGFLREPQFRILHNCSATIVDSRFTQNGLFFLPNASCLGPEFPAFVTVQHWMEARIQQWSRNVCATCHHQIGNAPYDLSDAPLILSIETFSDDNLPTRLIPSASLTFNRLPPHPPTTYRLFAIVYHGGFHYTSRIFISPLSASDLSSAWNYDGIRCPPTQFDLSSLPPEALLSLDGRSASFYLYALCI